ncbi:hypothetical protein GCM10023226_31990 [Nocardioides nanhaiensis]|uniref:NADPH-dependent FMN reductase-like domain-containing protein n=1 Tax=Nocardioides nanhaiensis TaxID=1476871 RepID=A0ABP8WP13_9ACTN
MLSAGLGVPSSTRLLADRLAEATVQGLAARGVTRAEVGVDVVELRALAHPLADRLVTGFPDATLEAAIAAVTGADALVAVTPVFSASYSGLFKTFFDVLEPGAIAGLPVLMGATAGTARHSLVLEHAVRPLFSYLRATPVPTGVFAATEDFGDGALQERVERAGGELAAAVLARRAAARPEAVVRPGGLHAVPSSVADDAHAATSLPFEELLRRAGG